METTESCSLLTSGACTCGKGKSEIQALKHLHLVTVSHKFSSLQQSVGQMRLLTRDVVFNFLRKGLQPPNTRAFGTSLLL